FRSSGAAVRRTVAFPGAGEERELADDEKVSSDLLDGAVHDAVFVIENPQTGDLPAQPLEVLVRVRLLDGQQHEQPLQDGPFDIAGDGDFGFGDSLKN